MSGTISRFLEANKEFNQSSNNDGNQQKTFNIPVKVTGYDGDYCLGFRVDTKESVRVKFRDVAVKNEANKRVDMREYADATNRKRFIDPNSDHSYILFENCYQEEDGTWNSRWGVMMSKPKKEASVFVFDANISIVGSGDNRFISVQAIKKKIPIQDENQFYNALIAGLTPSAYRSRPSVSFVFKDTSGDKIIQEFYPKMETDENNVKVALDPNDYINELYTSEKVQSVLQLISAPDVEVYAYLMTTLNYGADTNTVVLNNSFKVDRIEKEYKFKNENSVLKLFKKTVVAVRQRDDKSMFLTVAEPIENNVEGLPLDKI